MIASKKTIGFPKHVDRSYIKQNTQALSIDCVLIRLWRGHSQVESFLHHQFKKYGGIHQLMTEKEVLVSVYNKTVILL